MKETDLVNTWLWDKHREDLQWRRVRLGPLPTKEMARLYSVILRWADAVVVSNGEILIIEAKIRPGPGAIGQLEHYATLIKQTPEFSLYENLPVKLILLSMTMDLQLAEMCSQKGIIFEFYPFEEYADALTRMGKTVIE